MATVAAEPDDSPAAGILGGEMSFAAYLQYLGLESLEELEQKQLSLELEDVAAA